MRSVPYLGHRGLFIFDARTRIKTRRHVSHIDKTASQSAFAWCEECHRQLSAVAFLVHHGTGFGGPDLERNGHDALQTLRMKPEEAFALYLPEFEHLVDISGAGLSVEITNCLKPPCRDHHGPLSRDHQAMKPADNQLGRRRHTVAARDRPSPARLEITVPDRVCKVDRGSRRSCKPCGGRGDKSAPGRSRIKEVRGHERLAKHKVKIDRPSLNRPLLHVLIVLRFDLNSLRIPEFRDSRGWLWLLLNDRFYERTRQVAERCSLIGSVWIRTT